MNQVPLEKSILRTLVYFDIYSLPLKSDDLFRFLWRPPALSKEEFLSTLKMLLEQEKIQQYNGYYFLPNRESIVDEHLLKKEICLRKMKRARLAARILSWIPFLSAVFLCNSVAAGTATENSDIDFLIVTAPRRIWLVRLIANFLLKLLHLRTYGSKLSNRICLSFFVDEKHLDFATLRAVEEDIHFAYWISQTVPLFDPYYLWRDFQKQNQWIVRYLPYISYESLLSSGVVSFNGGKKFWRRIWETFWRGWYGDLLERQAEGLGRQRLKLSVKNRAEMNDNGVVITSGVIKLHEDDRRLSIRDRWIKVIKELSCF